MYTFYVINFVVSNCSKRVDFGIALPNSKAVEKYKERKCESTERLPFAISLSLFLSLTHSLFTVSSRPRI